MAEARIYIRVYFKQAWSAAWTLQENWEALSATLTAMPSISTAQIVLRFGEGKWENGDDLINGSAMDSRLFGYVQIRAYDGTAEYVWWTGVIPSESLAILGKRTKTNLTEIQTVDQTVTAYGLEYLLQTKISGSRVRRVGDAAGATAHSIEPALAFNRRHDRGGQVMGNRSTDVQVVTAAVGETDAVTAYVFSADGAEWRNADIIDYLIKTQCDDNGPAWSYYDSNAAIQTALENMVDVYSVEGQMLLTTLSALMSPGRGIGWYVTLIDENPVIVPYSVLETELTVNGFTIPKNDAAAAFDVFSDATYSVSVERDSANLFDKIVVRGSKIKSCFTAKISASTLEKAWTAAEETAYKAAAGTDPTANDLFRSIDRFRRVYTSFRIPSDWNWLIGASGSGSGSEAGNIALPKLNTNAVVVAGQVGEYFNVDKRFLTELPFKEGWDYSGAAAVDKNPDDSEEEFRPIMAWFTQDSKKVLAEKIPFNGANVRPLQREFGVEVRFSPQHLAALNHWSGAAATNQAPAASAVDYETLGVTGMVETDAFVAVEATIDDYATAEGRRTLTIDVPDCELWYVTPGTVVDIDDAGAEIAYGGSSNFVRDDRDKLRAILAAAKAWYHKRRSKITMHKEGLAYPYFIGTMVTVAAIGTDEESSSSVVTSISWDFGSLTTTIMTGFYEQDFAAMGTRTVPTLKAAARQIDALGRQVTALKSEQGKSPVRMGQGAEMTGRVRLAVLTANAGNGYTITADLVKDDGTQDTTGDGHNITVACSIMGGTRLDRAIPRLESGKSIFIAQYRYNPGGGSGSSAAATYWGCLTVFQTLDIAELDVVGGLLKTKLDACPLGSGSGS